MRFSAVLPNHSMHPLLRALLIVTGAALMAFLVIFGAMAILAIGTAGAIALTVQRWRMKRSEPAASAADQAAQTHRVLEGEYVVIDRPPHTGQG